jgi:putative endonuclease
MTNKVDLGKQGEEIAFQMLVSKGYRILDRNWRFQKEELDIVAVDKNCLVIVEVKTRGATIYEEPRESITSKKIRSLVNAAEAYIIEKDVELETRFDVVSIKWFGNGKYTIDHRENAFYPPVN